MVGRQRLSNEDLRGRRCDVTHLHVEAAHDGTPAVDYTVNAGVGIPDITGPEVAGHPVNQDLPAYGSLGSTSPRRPPLPFGQGHHHHSSVISLGSGDRHDRGCARSPTPRGSSMCSAHLWALISMMRLTDTGCAKRLPRSCGRGSSCGSSTKSVESSTKRRCCGASTGE